MTNRPSKPASAARSSGKAAETTASNTETSTTEASEPKAPEARAAESEETEALDKEIEALEETPADPEEIEDLKRKYMVMRFWQTARRFWTDRGSHIAWLMTGALFAIILLNLAAAYAMNVWNRNIFDALEKKEPGTVVTLSLVYVVILVISVLFAVVHVY